MSEKLLPCPFCGGNAEFHDTSSTWVRCEDCGAEIQCQIDKKDALIAWNRRAHEARDEPVAYLRYGEEVPVQNVPWGAMWISDKNDPRAFPVYRCQDSPIDVSEDMLDAYWRAKEIAEANIQGFYEEELGHHYVMDLRKPSGSQIIWEIKYITNAGYNAGHVAMLNALNRFVAIEAIGAALAGRAS